MQKIQQKKQTNLFSLIIMSRLFSSSSVFFMSIDVKIKVGVFGKDNKKIAKKSICNLLAPLSRLSDKDNWLICLAHSGFLVSIFCFAGNIIFDVLCYTQHSTKKITKFMFSRIHANSKKLGNNLHEMATNCSSHDTRVHVVMRFVGVLCNCLE